MSTYWSQGVKIQNTILSYQNSKLESTRKFKSKIFEKFTYFPLVNLPSKLRKDSSGYISVITWLYINNLLLDANVR